MSGLPTRNCLNLKTIINTTTASAAPEKRGSPVRNQVSTRGLCLRSIPAPSHHYVPPAAPRSGYTLHTAKLASATELATMSAPG